MLSSKELFLLLAVVSTASAVPQASALAELPSCASQGALQAITSSGCGATDIVCVCESTSFKQQFIAYATQNCSANDLTTAIAVSQAACDQAGVSVSTEDATAASTATTTAATDAITADPMASTDSTAITTEVDIGDAAATTSADPVVPSTTEIPVLGDTMTAAPYAMGNGTTVAHCTACSCSTSAGAVATFMGDAAPVDSRGKGVKALAGMIGLVGLFALF